MITKGDLNRYYKEIEKHLTCPKKMQGDLLAEAHRLVSDFLENQPDATYSDVVENIGKPDELAEAFLKTLPDQAGVQEFRKKRTRHKRLTVALLLVVIAVLCGILIYIGQMRYHTTVTEEITTIIGPEPNVTSEP